MMKVTVRKIVLMMLALFVLTACPRLNPKVGQRTDNRAAKFDAYLAVELDPQRDEWQAPDRVIEAAGVGEGDVVAVTWAGPGYFVMPLAKAVGPTGTVYASDPDMTMLEKLKEKVTQAGLTNVKFIQGKVDDPQLPYSACDAVFVVNAQAYIDYPYAFFDNIRRGLKTGGKAVIVDWKERTKKGPEHKLRRPKKRIEEMLEGMGFSLLEDRDFLPYQYLLIYKVVEHYGEVGGHCGI